MEVTQMTTTNSVSISVNMTSSFQSKSSTTFSEYMNNFLEAANNVRGNRRIEASVGENTADIVKKIDNVLKNVTKGVKSLGSDSTEENLLPVTPMNPQEKEAFDRIATLVADGSLDSESLAELSDEELADIASWVLSGANGLFEPYTENITEETSSEMLESSEAFGLNSGLAALDQIEDIYEKLSGNDLSNSDTAAIGDLIDLDGLDPVIVDKLSQAIVDLAEKYSGVTSSNESVASEADNNNDQSLRDMLKNVPTDELATEIKDILNKASSDVELPEMPESVVKSLCIEVVNVNNKMLDAADFNTKLLDGLNNNQELREQILQSISSPEASEELINTIEKGIESENAENVIDELASAVLEDSTPEEVAELTVEVVDNNVEVKQGLSDEIDNINTKVETNKAVQNEQPSNNSESLIKVDSEQFSSKETDVVSVQKNMQELEVDDNIKITLNKNTEENTEQLPKEQVKDSAKDNLTGRAYSGDNSSSEEEQLFEDETTDDNKSLKNNMTKGDGDALVTKDEAGLAFKSDFINNIAEAEINSDIKTVSQETTLSPYTSSNSQVKYADMIENMDRLSKLMVNNSDKAMKSVTMELSPPELGKLTIEVSVKDGNANAAIKVETDGAKNMLLNNIEQLKRNLESHGLKLENFEVELNKQDEQSRDQQNAFAQAQQEEQQRQSRRRNNGNTSLGADGSAGTENAESEEVQKKVINDDGSVDIVA